MPFALLTNDRCGVTKYEIFDSKTTSNPSSRFGISGSSMTSDQTVYVKDDLIF